jgi:hypothetical protein
MRIALAALVLAAGAAAAEPAGCTRVRVDGADWFTYRDPHPLASGYLGLRTTRSRQTVDDLTIQRLE